MLGSVQCTRDTKTKGVGLVHRVFRAYWGGAHQGHGRWGWGREGVYHILPFFPETSLIQ